MDVSKPLPKFIELVLAPRDRSEADAVEVQRMALESLREARPGMLIDHIEEPASGSGSGPVKLRPLFMRLRSHAEARTFDELRIYELGRLIRPDDPDWHAAVVDLVYQARAILVDTTGLVADPANEGAGQQRSRGAVKSPPPPSKTPRLGSTASSLPPISTSTAPSWGEPQDHKPSIEMPTAPSGPAELGRPVMPHVPQSAPRSAPRQAPARPPRRRPRQGMRFFALCEGRLYCPLCAQPMAIQSMGHERRSFYTCASKHLHPPTVAQPEVYFPVEAVDDAVWARAAERLGDPTLALEIIREAITKGDAGGQNRKAQARGRLERLERDELEVLKLRSEDRISEGAARHRLDEIGSERRKLQQELDSESDSDVKLRPFAKVLEELIAYAKRSSGSIAQADFGLRRRLIEACIPPTAEYGIFPHADGSLETRDLLEEHRFAPGLKHRARSLGRLAGDLKERVTSATPGAPSAAPKLLARVKALLDRGAATEKKESADLGKALQASVQEHQPIELRGRPPRSVNWPAYGFGLVVAILVAILFQPPKVEGEIYDDQAEAFGFAKQLDSLHEVPGGWIAVTHPLWEGAEDEALATQLCERMVTVLETEPRETIMLMVPGGLPLAECKGAGAPTAPQ